MENTVESDVKFEDILGQYFRNEKVEPVEERWP